jgi:hypothetical protein
LEKVSYLLLLLLEFINFLFPFLVADINHLWGHIFHTRVPYHRAHGNLPHYSEAFNT